MSDEAYRLMIVLCSVPVFDAGWPVTLLCLDASETNLHNSLHPKATFARDVDSLMNFFQGPLPSERAMTLALRKNCHSFPTEWNVEVPGKKCVPRLVECGGLLLRFTSAQLAFDHAIPSSGPPTCPRFMLGFLTTNGGYFRLSGTKQISA